MKLFYLQSFFILLLLPQFMAADPMDNVANLIKQGNAKELSKVFADNVEMTIMDDENSYSKAQATLIIDKFLNANKPKSIKLLHKVNSSASYHLGVYILTTDKGAYRVAITLKDVNHTMSLIELRIEDEKVK